jgi:glycosyltransferase involved in cell wall biosynthesis
MDVSVCIGTYGDPEWRRLARERAIPSAQAPVIHCHADTLAKARNAALAEVETEWVCFLDADDELAPGYFEAMERGTADVRGPVAVFVKPSRESPWQPRVAGHSHTCVAECLPEGNWLLIGSAMRTDLAKSLGGFREFAVYEDWDLFLRAYAAAATFELIPEAVYRAHVRLDSRNRAPSMSFKNQVHREIVAANEHLLAAHR